MTAFPLDPPIFDTVHKLRETRRGIQYLKETGRFRDYMDSRLRDSGKRNSVDNSRRYRANRTTERPFIAWDGEGWTDNDGAHRYMLFGCSTGQHVEYPLLNTRECLELMLNVGAEQKSRRPIHVIYGGGYDVTHILRDMPSGLRKELLDTGITTWLPDASLPTMQQRYTFEYRPHKWFTVSGIHWATGKRITVKLYDVMTFFQSSFIKALESRGIDVSEEIRSGKASRATFTFADMDEIKAYWQQELESLVMLCDKLRDEFKEAGLAVSQYYGPGAVANVTMKHYGVKRYMKRPSDELERVAAHAYFGGRFETFKVGHYEGKVYQADINSAYPDAIRNLPDLSNAEWEWTETPNPMEPGIYFCRYDSGNDYLRPHPLPWRGRGGVIGFPGQIDGGVWLWHFEAQYADHVDYGYRLHTDWSIRPFAFVEGMFTLRKEWKAQGRGGEKALKLAMNSLYGKLAQRIGGKNGEPPTWHQLEWAGMITSATRAKIWEAICKNPSSVISVETDSVTSTERLDLPYGDGLGEWDYAEYDWITYLQSGIYYTSGGSASGKSKTRGVDIRELPHTLVMEYLSGDRIEPLLIKSRNFISLSNPASSWAYGQWQDGVKELTISDGKRIHVPEQCSECREGVSMAESLHDLIAMPLYGVAPSQPHELPWRGEVVHSDNEMARIDTIAIEEWQ